MTHPARPRHAWTAAPLAFGVAALAVVVAVHACVEVEPGESSDWPTRDVLGLSPAWIEPLDATQRGALQERLVALAGEQAAAGEQVDADLGPPELADDLIRLDAERDAAGLAPLLVQRVERTDDGVAVATACPLTAAELLAPVEPGAAESFSWRIDPAFDDHPHAAGNERDALEQRLPRLGRWLARCLAGEDVREIELGRADGAPTLLIVSAERRMALVNPLLLHLWSADRALPDEGLRTLPQGLTVAELDTCVVDISNFCGSCDTPAKVQQARQTDPGACSRQLFPTGEVWDNCAALNFNVARGFYRYCLNNEVARVTTGSFSFNVSACMDMKVGANGQSLGGACNPRFVASPEELSNAYVGFIDPATSADCQREFVTCINSAQPPQNTPPPTEGSDDCSDFSDCGECGCENAFGLDDLCDFDGANEE